MHLVLNSYGAKLTKKDGRFMVYSKDGETSLSPDKIKSITIHKGVKITSDAIFLAIREEIDVIFESRTGMPEGRVWSNSYGSIATIRKNQLEFVFTSEAVRWIQDVLFKKLDNQTAILLSLKFDEEEAIQRKIQSAINTIHDHKLKIMNINGDTVADIAPSLRGWEGNASKRYFEALSLVLPEKYQFSKRSQHPATDAFNVLLNYGYGMLYGKIEAALIKAGLDPYVGVMHRDNYNRPVLVFDVIELFRAWIDHVVISLCQQDVFVEECFSSKNGGMWLEGLGKRILIQSVNEYLDEVISMNQMDRTRLEHIQQQAYRIAKQFK
jgi:CRISPR-associated protein Cas1